MNECYLKLSSDDFIVLLPISGEQTTPRQVIRDIMQTSTEKLNNESFHFRETRDGRGVNMACFHKSRSNKKFSFC